MLWLFWCSRRYAFPLTVSPALFLSSTVDARRINTDTPAYSGFAALGCQHNYSPDPKVAYGYGWVSASRLKLRSRCFVQEDAPACGQAQSTSLCMLLAAYDPVAAIPLCAPSHFFQGYIGLFMVYDFHLNNEQIKMIYDT